jgi:hypothetical protein
MIIFQNSLAFIHRLSIIRQLFLIIDMCLYFSNTKNNSHFISKPRSSSIKKKMIETFNDKKSNDRRQVISKDVHVQTELTVITLDNEETNFRRYLVSADVEINSNSLYKFDRPHLSRDRDS